MAQLLRNYLRPPPGHKAEEGRQEGRGEHQEETPSAAASVARDRELGCTRTRRVRETAKTAVSALLPGRLCNACRPPTSACVQRFDARRAAALGAAGVCGRVWRRAHDRRFNRGARVACERPRHAGLLLLLGQQAALSEIQRLERSEHLLELAATRRSAAVRASAALPTQQLRERDGHRRRGELRHSSQSARDRF